MKVFVAGPRAISKLNSNIVSRLKNLIDRNFMVLVGDANGIDKAVQNFFSENNYDKVRVFSSNGKVRNNLGNWNVECVNVPSGVKGFDFYAAKDIEMANHADYGFMIWNGKSRGTFTNIVNLVNQRKDVLIYFTPHKKFYKVSTPEAINQLLKIRDQELTNNPDRASEIKATNEQVSLF
ncbi:hypothetical protein [Sporolactobacillus sp. THM19-2]|jgi:hypothetical protein|uniref:hypothetical protein n=1 Tax=Sporolactobacillus sp. THM19-2 TaxID=2511171 RepID=UPI00101F95A0|nr:hypothetical protein [Sporolactobacillus sp. THM19-2]RYL94425.1 hypothetical protein EWH91_00075 [Sporolactobacillus sp. THM19-2]